MSLIRGIYGPVGLNWENDGFAYFIV